MFYFHFYILQNIQSTKEHLDIYLFYKMKLQLPHAISKICKDHKESFQQSKTQYQLSLTGLV